MIVHNFEDIIALPSTGKFGSAAFSADTGMGEMIFWGQQRHLPRGRRSELCQSVSFSKLPRKGQQIVYPVWFCWGILRVVLCRKCSGHIRQNPDE